MNKVYDLVGQPS